MWDLWCSCIYSLCVLMLLFFSLVAKNWEIYFYHTAVKIANITSPSMIDMDWFQEWFMFVENNNNQINSPPFDCLNSVKMMSCIKAATCFESMISYCVHMALLITYCVSPKYQKWWTEMSIIQLLSWFYLAYF